MKQNLYRFKHEPSNLEGLFFATEEEVKGISQGTVTREEISAETAVEMFHHFGETVSGYNPLETAHED